eukprot:GEMP01063665.1.p1 GENE.GEMP01063665.1~~GEMP01063665.1.p1  ORF type:complete len:227 (+),score=30.25 GEMP01063665.1:30-683(+)
MYAFNSDENGVLLLLTQLGPPKRKVRGFSPAALTVLLIESFILVILYALCQVSGAVTHPVVSLVAIPLVSTIMLHHWLGIVPCRLARPSWPILVYACSVVFTPSIQDRVLVAVIVPICEEILYRVVIPTVIYNRLPSTQLASLCSAVVFAASHKWDPVATVAGLCFTIRFVKSERNLLDSLLLHCVHNLFAQPDSEDSTMWIPICFYASISVVDLWL